MTWPANHPPHSSDGFWSALRRALVPQRTPQVRLSSQQRAELIERTCQDLQRGHSWSVEALLQDVGEPGDAECLNLLGVIHEMRRQWRFAKRCYGRAIRADRHFEPAQQNMRRMYELETFGSSKLPPTTGHVLTDTCLARAHRRGAQS
jgi:hypothetical protein